MSGGGGTDRGTGPSKNYNSLMEYDNNVTSAHLRNVSAALDNVLYRAQSFLENHSRKLTIDESQDSLSNSTTATSKSILNSIWDDDKGSHSDESDANDDAFDDDVEDFSSSENSCTRIATMQDGGAFMTDQEEVSIEELQQMLRRENLKPHSYQTESINRDCDNRANLSVFSGQGSEFSSGTNIITNDLHIIPTLIMSAIPFSLRGTRQQQREAQSIATRGVVLDYTTNKRMRTDPVKRWEQYQKQWKRDRLDRNELGMMNNYIRPIFCADRDIRYGYKNSYDGRQHKSYLLMCHKKEPALKRALKVFKPVANKYLNAFVNVLLRCFKPGGADCLAPFVCSVYFRVKLPTEFQETVGVVGSCPELGNWDPREAVSLITNEDAYPCWCTPVGLSLPIRRRIDYKYVILGPDGRFRRWEDYKENRSVIPNGVTMVVEDDEGAGRNLSFNISLSMGSLNKGGLLSTDGEPMLTLGIPTTGDVDEISSTSRNASACSHNRSLGVNGPRREPSEVVRELQESEVPPITHENVMLLITSFELPLKVLRSPNGGFQLEKQKSLVMPQLHNLRSAIRLPVKFVGWPGIIVDSEAEQNKIEELLEPYDCVPVFLNNEALEHFFSFCRQCLWPVFHNVLVLDSQVTSTHTTDGWSSYQHINRIYADTVVRQAHEADLIWVHDFHLLLVPQYITRRIRNANVGFFLHIPFPSSEVFRCLPMREEILRGMLFADLIGFHFFEYARHFLVACKRLLGLDHHFRMGGFLEVDYGGRNVMIRIGHVHVQYDELRRIIDGSEIVDIKILEMRKQFEGRFVFASIDRCERLGGIILKLKGFQNFLRYYPYARRRAVLVQYAYPSTHAWESPKAYCEELRQLVNEINSEFGDLNNPEDGPVILEVRSVTPEEKYALFTAADCLLDTSIRDGLNLNPFEYISCRKDDPAPLILSEFTGCCRTLASAIRVNPWRVEDITQALDRAMNTPGEELADRFLRDQMYLERNSTLQWAEEFLIDLQRARKKEDLVYVSWGFGTTYRVCGLASDFQYLNCDLVVHSFRAAKRRILFFDHEGTLAPDRRRITAVPGFEALTATGSAPSAGVRRYLSALCATRGNTVVILSGRDRCLLDEWFGDIPGIGLCAEHGFYYKVPSVSGSQWQCLSSTTGDFTWKAIAMELMRQYVKRTQGAFVENKGSALVFQYRDADPDFGSWQAKELSNYLEELLFGCPVTVMSGKGYVEVKLRGVNKGQAVQTVLRKLSQRDSTPVDFVLCIGDDRSDEDMFPVVDAFFDITTPKGTPTSANTAAIATAGTSNTLSDSLYVSSDFPPWRSLRNENKQRQQDRNPDHGKRISLDHNLLNRRSVSLGLSSEKRPGSVSISLPVAFSVTVGKKPSNAKNYLNDVEDVSDLLESLALNK